MHDIIGISETASMIELHLNKKYYFVTNVVEGEIKLKVEKLMMIKSLELKFYKKQSFLLKKIDGSAPEVLVDESRILKENTVQLCENSELDVGEYIFPFRFKLKHEENGTGKVKGYFYDSVCNIENVCMVVGRCNTTEGDHKVEKTLSIFDKSEEKCQTDIKIKMNTFICMFERTMLYRILLDKVWYFKGDNITIDCFSVTRTLTPVVASVSGKLYQVVVLNTRTNMIKPKLMSTSIGFPVSKNRFKLQFRIPINAGPTITEENFSVRMLLFIELKLYNASIIKIRKYLNVGEPSFDLPEIERKYFSQGKIFPETLFEY